MEEYFLEYLTNALDADTKAAVEAYLERNPAGRARLASLREVMAPLAFDAESPPPPPCLAERTLARVAEHICAAPRDPAELPQAPPITPASLPAPRSWWRRADALIAVCLFFAVVGIGLTILGRLRGPTSAVLLAECQNNLRQFGVALQTYHDQNRKFPDIAREEAPRDVAGMFVPILHDAGALPSSASIRCPGVGAPMSNQLSLAALRGMNAADFEQHAACLSLCYAYSLGYREAGVYHGPADHPQASKSQTPMMADRPPAEGVFANSLNHGGSGQNVLFADGSVRFLPNRLFGADDIFVNRDRKVAAGLDVADAVLGYSSARPKAPGLE